MAPIFSASFAVSAFKIRRLVLHRSVVRVVTDAQQPPGIPHSATFRVVVAVVFRAITEANLWLPKRTQRLPSRENPASSHWKLRRGSNLSSPTSAREKRPAKTSSQWPRSPSARQPPRSSSDTSSRRVGLRPHRPDQRIRQQPSWFAVIVESASANSFLLKRAAEAEIDIGWKIPLCISQRRPFCLARSL